MGDDYKGYVFRITGGNDKQGFSMKQGGMVNGRVRILLRARTQSYRPRRTGERKRKSVRGCICGPDMAVIFLKVLEKGPGEVAGLTDSERPRRLGPKRVSRIRTAFALRKKDDVRKYVVRRDITRTVKKKQGDEEWEVEKKTTKAGKIQRLITEKRLRRKRLQRKQKKDRWALTKNAHVAYEKLLSKFLKEKKAAYKTAHASTTAEAEKKPAKPEPTKEAAKPKATSGKKK
jgi:small subunit ribosomal protein S6e